MNGSLVSAFPLFLQLQEVGAWKKYPFTTAAPQWPQAGDYAVPSSEKRQKKNERTQNFQVTLKNQKRGNPFEHETRKKSGQKTNIMLKQQEEENTVFERCPEGKCLIVSFLLKSPCRAVLGYTI